MYCVTLNELTSSNLIKTPLLDESGKEIDLNKKVEVKVVDNNYEYTLNDDCMEAKGRQCKYDGELVQGTEFVDGQYTYRYKQSMSEPSWSGMSEYGELS